MERKKKIIFITISFVVLISIIGITYAYIGTKILGNSTSKKMSFTSKKLNVIYKEISSTSSGETISPGYEYLKIFTAASSSNVAATYHIYLDEVENNFIRVQDITYTLYRKSGNNTITSSNLSSAEVIASGVFPISNQYIKTDEVLNSSSDVYTYALKINYNTSTENQDSDSGHIFGFKVQLHTSKNEIYNDFTLLSNILKNSTDVDDSEEQNGTAKYRPTPTTSVATTINNSTEADLSYAMDDYGKSFYFRGNVKNNYVDFAGMCWRAVRIAGDESIKLILEDQDNVCAESDGNWNIPTTVGGNTKTSKLGYTQYDADALTASDGTKNTETKYVMDYLNGETNSTNSVAIAFKNFQTGLNSKVGASKTLEDYLKVGDWCLNNKAYASSSNNSTELTSQEILDKRVNGVTFYYDSGVRLHGKSTKEPTFKCNGVNMNKFADNTDMYVGTLTSDELVYAGGKVNTSNPNYYLINNYQSTNSLNFWSLSPHAFYGISDDAYRVKYDGNVDYNWVISNLALRPSVNLKKGVLISSGIGTQTDPYVIE